MDGLARVRTRTPAPRATATANVASGSTPPLAPARAPSARRRRRFAAIHVPGRTPATTTRADENTAPATSPAPAQAPASKRATAAEEIVARTREQWRADTYARLTARESESDDTRVNAHTQLAANEGSVTATVMDFMDEDGPAPEEGEEEDASVRRMRAEERAREREWEARVKEVEAGAAVARRRPYKPYKAARPETTDQWKIEAVEIMQARPYTVNNGYACTRPDCLALLQTVGALAAHLRAHDIMCVPPPPALRSSVQCARCGGMYEYDRGLAPHKCASASARAPSARSALLLAKKVKKVARKCVAAVALRTARAPRYEPY